MPPEVVLEPAHVKVVERIVIRGPLIPPQQVAPSLAHGPLLGNGILPLTEQPTGNLRHGLRSRRVLIPQPPLLGVTKHRLLMRGVLLGPTQLLPCLDALADIFDILRRELDGEVFVNQLPTLLPWFFVVPLRARIRDRLRRRHVERHVPVVAVFLVEHAVRRINTELDAFQTFQQVFEPFLRKILVQIKLKLDARQAVIPVCLVGVVLVHPTRPTHELNM